MPDEPSLGEVVRRLDRMEVLLQDLTLRLVSADVYTRDQREIGRRLTELERDLADRRREHAEDVKDLRARIDDRDKTSGTNVRQAIYAGLIPAVLFLVTILLQLKGGK